MKTVTPSVSGHPIVFRPTGHSFAWGHYVLFTVGGAAILLAILILLALVLGHLPSQKSLLGESLSSAKNGSAGTANERAADFEESAR